MDGRVTSGLGMKAAISKIQTLTDQNLGFPLFYCHRDDRDHEPELSQVERRPSTLGGRLRPHQPHL